jgi:hypothetical protein
MFSACARTSAMSPEAVALLGGLLFLLIAIVGGGFTAKEISLPGVPGWARIASLALGLALLVPYFAQTLRSGEARSPGAISAASIDLPSPPPDGIIKDARNRRDASPAGIEVSGLIATSAGSHPGLGDSIDVEFTLRNVGSEAVALEDAFVGVRTPDGENGDFANSDQRAVLKPRQALKINGSRVFDAAGTWTIFPCYQLTTGEYCPSEWRSFQVLVGG